MSLVLKDGLSDTAGVVTLRTWAFAIRFINSSTPVAHALICPDAEYVAVRWQDGRLDRRHVPASLWPGLELELTRNLTAGPVSKLGMINTVLVGSMGAVMDVAFVESQPIPIRRREDAEAALDAATRSTQPV